MSYADDSTVFGNGDLQNEAQPVITDWEEPALKAPQPSFMDHKGMERGGVLDQMMPLGTPPTSRQKARPKADYHRPRAHGGSTRLVDGPLLDDTRGPSETSNPSEVTRAASLKAEEQSLRASPVIDDVSNHPTRHETPQTSASQQLSAPTTPLQEQQTPMRSTQQTPASSSRAALTQEPSDRKRSPFALAVESVRSRNIPNRISVEEALHALYAAEENDPQFRACLFSEAGNSPSHEDRKAWRDAVKEMKRNRHTFIREVDAAHLPKGPASPTHPTKRPLSNLTSSSTTIDYQSSSDAARQLPTARPSMSNHATPLKISLRAPIPPSTASSTLKMRRSNGSPLKQVASHPGGANRRQSSSSLSSVDAAVIEEPPVSLTTNDAVRDLKRPSADMASTLEEDAEELAARRKRMKRSFDNVVVRESALRPPLPSPHAARFVANSASSRSRTSASRSMRETFINGDTGMADTMPDLTNTPIPTALGRPPKKKQPAARIKHSPVKNKKAAMIAGVVRSEGRRNEVPGREAQSAESDNNDFCSSCGGGGFLLCCDGCDKAYHFTCLDPPLNHSASLDEPWFCYECKAKKKLESEYEHGLFSTLQAQMNRQNPEAFRLPDYIQTFFEGVRAGPDGEYVEEPVGKSSGKVRVGHDDAPDWQRLRDAKGNAILCYACGKSALQQSGSARRDIVQCDHCSLSWHLDCLNPPRANPPNRGIAGQRYPWMCPNHTDHDLRHLDPIQQIGVQHDGIGRTHRVRRPRNAKIIKTHLRRGHINSGLIEVETDESDDSGFESDEAPSIPKLPAKGIKLDFIDKVKSNRDIVRRNAEDESAQLRLANERHVARNMRNRSIRERQAMLHLLQLSEGDGAQTTFAQDEMANLVMTLEAEAPGAVTESINAYETWLASSSLDGSAESDNKPARRPLSAEDRQALLKIQQIIAQRLQQATFGKDDD